MLCDICGGPPDLSEGAAVPVGGVDGGEDEVGRALQHVHGDLHNHGHDYMDILFSLSTHKYSEVEKYDYEPEKPKVSIYFYIHFHSLSI